MLLNVTASPWAMSGLIFALLAARMAYVRTVRFNHRDAVEKRFEGKYALSKEDEKRGLKRMNKSGLRGVRDAQYIFRNMSALEQPFVTLKSLEFSLFKTYGIPSISKILLRTGQFVYADTAVLIAAFFTYALPALDLDKNDVGRAGENELWPDEDDPRSAIAFARINFLHRRADALHGPHGAPISNDDMLYTLSTFMLEPVLWYKKAGWRDATPLEAEALFTVFYHSGRCLNIKDVPETLEDMKAWAESYEQKHMVFAPQNHEVAVETIHLLLYHVPRALRAPFFPIIASLLSDRLRKAFGLAAPSAWVSSSTSLALRAVGTFVLLFCAPRSKPKTLLPLGTDNILDGSVDMGICPASGAKAADGRVCPVGGEEKARKASKPRSYPNWVENEPIYMPSAAPGSLRYLWERVFVAPENRYGARRFTAAGKQGYRIEEAGPRGLENAGQKEVLLEAERIHGGPIRGKWAFEA
ncbi:Domain of unknown function DUF2236 [Ceraceosorus bombacis]|uniref:ER-bound oxygenase mpaB/mpaB'/Rubber oxygenase catalytic domain-containing protein n=1 Tax=Ceraceosorus bombacis TaxID=401625 RepID=A0A0P1BT95_9BASI|nr:Domain of unknown function DUF2236 [Ceraceosorus bombacis]